MFGISGEHLLILAIVLIIFGPRRLPELGHTLGKAMRNFKDSVSGVEEAKFKRVEAEEKLAHSKVEPLKSNTAQDPLAEPVKEAQKDDQPRGNA